MAFSPAPAKDPTTDPVTRTSRVPGQLPACRAAFTTRTKRHRG
ncbi:hypothetical protein ACWDGI_40540 [Streptomyces sp. NPDC001220]